MAVTLTNSDFSANGIAILKDSREYPMQDGTTDEGINGTIRFMRFSWHRDLTVEFRSKVALAGFASSLGQNDGLLVNYDDTDYYLDSISSSAPWGGFGSEDTNAVWEYTIALKRPGTVSSSGGGTGQMHV